MQDCLQKLANAVRIRISSDGCHATAISDLSLYRYTQTSIQMPEANTPYLYLLAAGSMRLYTPSGMMDYVAGQYSISAIDTPSSGYALSFSEKADFLALSIRFTLDDVISLALDMGGDLPEKIICGNISDRCMEKADRNLVDAAVRLLSILDDPVQLAYMSRHIKREIIFQALCGSCGKQFLQSMISIQAGEEIYAANSWIKQNFRKTFSVEELALQWNMSVSAFHQKFKSAVGMGPLQCQKRLRLTEARRLMLDENFSVTDAAMEVGYESVSQFIRDYRKMFTAPPKEDVQSLRRQFSKGASSGAPNDAL